MAPQCTVPIQCILSDDDLTLVKRVAGSHDEEQSEIWFTRHPGSLSLGIGHESVKKKRQLCYSK